MTDSIILYVDDEWPNRIVFEQSFAKRFPVKAVASGEEALAVLEQQPVAVLVTDQRMPGMSGNELLERAKELSPDTVRVVITAYSDLDPILKAVNAGLVARYIIKPWDRGELEQILVWGREAYSLGRESTQLQLRLLQTERLVTLGSIAASVLHDLNAPVAHLRNNAARLCDLADVATALRALVEGQPFSSLLPDERARIAELAEELPQTASDLRFGAEQMNNLTQSIQRLLKPGERPGTETSAEPAPVLRYALSVCQATAQQHRARLRYDGPSELPRVAIGPTELTQIAINLIANAAQAIDRKEGGDVVVTAADDGAHLVLRVVDNGCGMAPEVLEKVGKQFFSTRPEGTGLGVAQCKRLVEGIGGKFALESRVGGGTVATVRLPKSSGAR